MFLDKIFGDQFQPLENVLNNQVIFCLLVMFQGCFGGMGVAQRPKVLENLLSGRTGALFRFIFVMCIAYTASKGEVEFAIFCTTLFFLFLHILRTEEERAEVPYFV